MAMEFGVSRAATLQQGLAVQGAQPRRCIQTDRLNFCIIKGSSRESGGHSKSTRPKTIAEKQDLSSWFGASLNARQNSCKNKVVKCNRNTLQAVLDDVPHLSDWITDLPEYPNPLQDNPAYAYVGEGHASSVGDLYRQYFVDEKDVVVKDIVVKEDLDPSKVVYFRRAGPRKKIVFKPDDVRACIVTCGGLCPGLNTVIREVVCGLWNQYGVREIFGIDGGYRGFYARNIENLTPREVNDIHKKGGTILHTSRGGHETSKIVNAIEDRGINQVYIIGGDGTQRGASLIAKEIQRRGLKVAVAGIPKTIDNDIAVIDRSFGFDTAVEEAQRAINAAHVEAESVENGLGLVKVMGRYSGYIAMYATLASRDVDCCLIPEVPFYLEGEDGLYAYIRRRLRENGHMVLVVAEGAGQELIASSMGENDSRDASGNRLLQDVGLWLSQMIKERLVKEHKFPVNLKYIDPTYMIRAIPSNAADNVYCTLLAHSAIHGAMAGYTGFISGPVNGRHAYIPIERVTEVTNKVKVSDRMWARLLSSTQQPSFLPREEIQRRRKGYEEEEEVERHVAASSAGGWATNKKAAQPQSSQSQDGVAFVIAGEKADHVKEGHKAAAVDGASAVE